MLDEHLKEKDRFDGEFVNGAPNYPGLDDAVKGSDLIIWRECFSKAF